MTEPATPKTPSRSYSFRGRDSNGSADMDDPQKTMATVSRFIEQLHGKSSPHEKELITSRLLGISRARKEARALIGTNAQAMPLFVSILRSGTHGAKLNVAATLSVLCRDEDIRVKVLLGGCVPPLLLLLKSGSVEERKAAGEALCAVSAGGLSDDHVGMKIFVTEEVVPTLWDQLNPKKKQDKVVEGFVTGALRNLCGDKEGYWTATLDAGGVDIILKLLLSDNVAAQSNAASLLARLMLTFEDSIPKIIKSGGIKALLGLLGQKNDISVRANSAEALEALSSKSANAKKALVEADGVHILIGAIVAPSKECIRGEAGQNLQRHAARALANTCGGMSALIRYLAELSKSPRLAAPVADIIGALAYALTIFEKKAGEEEEALNAIEIEATLTMLLKPRDNKAVQDRVLEAMASLFGNTYLSSSLNQAEGKQALTGLIITSASDVQENLILSLIKVCSDGVSIWEAIGKREGVQLLINLLGLSSEYQQDFAVRMLAVLTNQVDDSKWAITAAGGIPPLVQLLETGSQITRENAAYILWNLCCHSEEIFECILSAGAVPGFISLLKSSGPKAQEISVRALLKLVRTADSVTIDQLLELLLGDSPRSKAHVIGVLGHVLSMASQSDLMHKGGAANKGLRSLVQVLNASNEETQEFAASVLADIFSSKQDICESFASDDILRPCKKLLSSNTGATKSAQALSDLFRQIKKESSNRRSYVPDGDIKALIKLAKTSPIDTAERAMCALSNLLYTPKNAAEAMEEDVVSALTRVLGEGSSEGKKNATRALHLLLKHYQVNDVLKGTSQCRFAVLSIVESLNAMDMNWTDTADALEVVALLARSKQGENFAYPPWAVLAEIPSSLGPLIHCIAEGPPPVQDKAIEIVSRLCGDQPVILGDLLVETPGSIVGLANRIMNSASLEVRVGGAALLICAAKEHKIQTMAALDGSGYIKPLIYALVDMMKRTSSCSSLEIEVRTPRAFVGRTAFQEGSECELTDPAMVLGGTVALWLLSIVSSSHAKNRLTVVEAGALEVLAEKLASYIANPQAGSEDTEGIWISALLLAILFQDANVVSSPVTMRIVPSLSLLLRSEEVIDRFFAAQAMASLVRNGSKGMNLTIANSDTVAGLISLIGHVESDMPNLVALTEEFSLVRNPDQVVLEHLLDIEDVRVGFIARKAIPSLVNLLMPMPDRPGAPPTAVSLLTRFAKGSDANKVHIAESGALDALTKYLSLSPQDLTEATISELLRILYTDHDLLQYRASFSSMTQLVAVLHLGSRDARLSAARALYELFHAEDIRESEAANQAVQPLVEMLEAASESEQNVALVTLTKLTSGNPPKAAAVADVEGNPLGSICRILTSASSLELKMNAAHLCSSLFSNPNLRADLRASDCIEPLILLLQSDTETAVQYGVCAFEKLLDDVTQVEITAAHDIVKLLVGLASGSNERIIEASLRALIKLGKDRTPQKLDMVNAGVVSSCLELLPTASGALCAAIAELFRILTNSSAISKSSTAAIIVEPLFSVLLRPDISLLCQHSALQALVNIMEKPQNLAALKLTPSQIFEPLLSFLGSSSQAIQHLGAELLNLLLAQEYFKQDITSKSAVVPLVRLLGTGILNLQQTAIKALETISLRWPKEIADGGGVSELAKIVVQENPQPPHALWESTALVLSNILHSNADHCFDVPPVVLVKMLYSTQESTLTVALNALIRQESTDPLSAELMAEEGALDALLDLLRSHKCEELAGRLLEALFNNARIREMKVCKYAIAPLTQYLLDPQTKSQSGRLLAALSLGDLSQHEGHARSSDSPSACRALVRLLQVEPTEEIKMVAVCALQNFVMRSRTNRRAVADAGGILVIQELLTSTNLEVVPQAALLIRFLFSNHTLQEHVSNELIKSLTAALEIELQSTGTVIEEVLKAILVIFTNFNKLHISEATTLCIPHLVAALNSPNEAAQNSTLHILCALKHSWTTIPADISKAQASIAAEAIPTLQKLMKSGPPSFRERTMSLLHSLPGCLTVTIKSGNNLKHVAGGTYPFCRLKIGNSHSRHTKVVNNSTCPEWNEGFTWAFDEPPKGEKLYILCNSKGTFGKTSLGRVAIQIDKVLYEGMYSGPVTLKHESNKDDNSRTLDIELIWTNQTQEMFDKLSKVKSTLSRQSSNSSEQTCRLSKAKSNVSSYTTEQSHKLSKAKSSLSCYSPHLSVDD